MPNLLSSFQALITRYLRPMDHSRFLPSLLDKQDGQSCPFQDFHSQYLRCLGDYFHLVQNTAGSERPLLARCRISRVELMKKPSLAQHEYILMYITIDGAPWADQPSRVGKLVCERAGAVPEDSSSSSSSSSDTTRQKLPESIRLSGAPGPRALDQYVVYGPDSNVGHLDDVAYRQEMSPTSSLPLTFLFAIVDVIHEDSQYYLVLTRQCYYFALLLYRALIQQRAAELKALTMRDPNLIVNEGDHTTTHSLLAGTFQVHFKLVGGDDIEKHNARLDASFTQAFAAWQAKAQGREDIWSVGKDKDEALAAKDEALAAKDEEILRLRATVAATQMAGSNAVSTAES